MHTNTHFKRHSKFPTKPKRKENYWAKKCAEVDDGKFAAFRKLITQYENQRESKVKPFYQTIAALNKLTYTILQMAWWFRQPDNTYLSFQWQGQPALSPRGRVFPSWYGRKMAPLDLGSEAVKWENRIISEICSEIKQQLCTKKFIQPSTGRRPVLYPRQHRSTPGFQPIAEHAHVHTWAHTKTHTHNISSDTLH